MVKKKIQLFPREFNFLGKKKTCKIKMKHIHKSKDSKNKLLSLSTCENELFFPQLQRTKSLIRNY